MPNNQFKRDILQSDFEQSMEMLRHYDNFHWDITKFCFSQICVVIGACWYIYENIGQDKQNLRIGEADVSVISILLVMSSLFTFLCLVSIFRNRSYFCKVSHYINELRQYSLSESNDLGFSNSSGMWCDPAYPQKYDGWSTQFLSVYLLSFCAIGSGTVGGFIVSSDESAFCHSALIAVIELLIIVITGFICCRDD